VAKRRELNFCTYDMNCYSDATSLFRYIHTMPVEGSWNVLKQALDDIRNGLHGRNVRKSDGDTISRYISSKVDKNLAVIREDDRYIKALEQYDVVYVNGKPFRTLGAYGGILDWQNLMDKFINDSYADIHGDLTIENIVCLGNSLGISDSEYEGKIKPRDYYFIDPNTGNVHDSPFLDYAKLLQSLHGNYEFLMMVIDVSI
jgi:hypothetical protein